MIKVKVSTEVIEDLFTPGVLVPHECVDGLPKNATLIDIKKDFPTKTITYYFDDGKEEVTKKAITFESV